MATKWYEKMRTVSPHPLGKAHRRLPGLALHLQQEMMGIVASKKHHARTPRLTACPWIIPPYRRG